jgi:hypothetical protein
MHGDSAKSEFEIPHDRPITVAEFRGSILNTINELCDVFQTSRSSHSLLMNGMDAGFQTRQGEQSSALVTLALGIIEKTN